MFSVASARFGSGYGYPWTIYTVNHKKGGSTLVIVTLENLDGF